jgi:hypothetical protein
MHSPQAQFTKVGRRDGRQKPTDLCGTGLCALSQRELRRVGQWDATALGQMDSKFQAAMTAAITSGAEVRPQVHQRISERGPRLLIIPRL